MSQVSWVRQLILAVVLFTLGTVAYWLEFKHKPEKEKQEEQEKRLLAIKDTQIKSITLHNGNQTFTFNCSDLQAHLCKTGEASRWELAEPRKFKADDANVNSLLTTLGGLTSSETIDLSSETPEKKALLLKDYGLDPTSRKLGKQIKIVTTSNETVLSIGQEHPIGGSFFVIKEGPDSNPNVVYLLPTYIKGNLEHDLTFWRDKKLLVVAPNEIESFELEGPQTHLSASRVDGQWILKSDHQEVTGDNESIDRLLSAATSAVAKNFSSDDKNSSEAKGVLNASKKMVTLSLQKGKGSEKEKPAPILLSLFEKRSSQKKAMKKGGPEISIVGDQLFGTVSNLDPLFQLDVGFKDRVNKNLKDLRMSKLLSMMDHFSTRRLEFSGKPVGKSPVVLTQTDGKWKNQANQKEEIPQDKIRDLLDKLSGNRIVDFMAATDTPPGEKDGLILKMGDDKNAAKHSFVFWKKDKRLYGKDLQSKRNETFVIDSALEGALPWDQDYFQAKPNPTQPKTTSPASAALPAKS